MPLEDNFRASYMLASRRKRFSASQSNIQYESNRYMFDREPRHFPSLPVPEEHIFNGQSGWHCSKSMALSLQKIGLLWK
jgi:hypothetical protein